MRSVFVVSILLAVVCSVLVVAPGSGAVLPPLCPVGPCEAWSERYDSADAGLTRAEGVAVAPDGSAVFVTGLADEDTRRSDITTVAYEALGGARLWSATFNGADDDADYGYGVAVSPDSSTVYVVGTSDQDYVVLAYDAASGATLWETVTDVSGRNDALHHVAASADGARVYVAGNTHDGRSWNYGVGALDASTGAFLWHAEHNAANNWDTLRGFTYDATRDHVFVTGQSYTGSAEAYVIATGAYDGASGVQVWLAEWNGDNAGNKYDVGHAVAVAADGSRLAVSGYTNVDGQETDYVTLSYDPDTGLLDWAVTYDGAGDQDVARGVAVAPDGSAVYTTGQSMGATGNSWDLADYATVAYDASGAEAWVARFDGTASKADDGQYVFTDGDKVFVAGTSEGAASFRDFVTLAYDAATGVMGWTGTYDGGNSDYLNTATLDADNGILVVAGREHASGNVQGYRTVAYQTVGLLDGLVL